MTAQTCTPGEGVEVWAVFALDLAMNRETDDLHEQPLAECDTEQSPLRDVDQRAQAHGTFEILILARLAVVVGVFAAAGALWHVSPWLAILAVPFVAASLRECLQWGEYDEFLKGVLIASFLWNGPICTFTLMVAALFYWKIHEDLVRHWTFFARNTAHVTRCVRRADETAEQWAYWLSENAPIAILYVLLEMEESLDRPQLRSCWYWLPLSSAVCCEAGLIVLPWLVSVAQFLTTVPVAKPPPGAARQIVCRNICTSWAVLLRCPLHLARGDGIAASL